uniref:Uncharacterized protein n=1 Tax=Gopherus evgoodei TaxID=1825980 RepID=A0A8C4YK72_9SAUR
FLCRGSVAMSCSLLLLLLLLPPWGAGGCLHCDRPFLRGLGVLLGEAVPSEVPNRDALIQRQVEAFERLYSTHLPEKHHRVLGAMLAVKAALSGWLRALKETPWKGESVCGVNLGGLRVAQGGVSLWVPDLVPSFHIPAVTEGPVLDCWTCLRINAQCFDGELCGEEDPRDAERKEITLYLFLVLPCLDLGGAGWGAALGTLHSLPLTPTTHISPLHSNPAPMHPKT